jgi:hypothetical protein
MPPVFARPCARTGSLPLRAFLSPRRFAPPRPAPNRPQQRIRSENDPVRERSGLRTISTGRGWARGATTPSAGPQAAPGQKAQRRTASAGRNLCGGKPLRGKKPLTGAPRVGGRFTRRSHKRPDLARTLHLRDSVRVRPGERPSFLKRLLQVRINPILKPLYTVEV